MARRKQSRLATRRQGVVAFAVFMWVVVVAAGAGSDADDSLLGVDNIDVVWIIVFGTSVVASIVFLIWLKPFTEWVEPEKKKQGIGVWIFAGLVILFLIFRPDFLSELVDEDAAEELGSLFEIETEAIPDEAPVETVAQATDILLLLAGLAAVAGVWFLMRRRASNAVDPLDEHAATALEIDLVDALDQAARELDTSGDPRTAVLRSYAVLEVVLSSHGLARATAETATEHLQRATKNLRIDDAPVAQLGGLYEIARFSEHPISTTQQDDAIAALRQAQASLASLA